MFGWYKAKVDEGLKKLEDERTDGAKRQPIVEAHDPMTVALNDAKRLGHVLDRIYIHRHRCRKCGLELFLKINRLGELVPGGAAMTLSCK